MGVKSYRITSEQEFYESAVKYVNNLIDSFMAKVDDRYLDKRKKRDIYKKYSIYKTYRDYPNVPTDYLLKSGLAVLLEDVDDWCNFSCSKTASAEEIMMRIILSNLYNCSLISTLMVSCNSNLTEDFIKDCIFASFPLFSFDDWDDEHVEAVVSCAASGLPANKCKRLIELYGKDRLPEKPVSVRFDFGAFNLNILSDDFKSKFYTKNNEGNLIARY